MSFDERVLNGMGVFAAIVRNGSFAGAGVALNLSQSGVSRSIARLEGRLGLRLFERTTRSITITDEGRNLYEQISPLLAGLEEAAASVNESRTLVRGRLRIKMHPVFAHLLAGPRFKGFLESHPQLNIELITQDRLGDLVGEGFDLAIHLGEPPASSLVARKLWDTSIITAAAPEYLKRYGRPASPQDMRGSGHVLIDFRNPETSRPFEWEFHRGRKIVQVPTRGHLTVSDIVTLHNLCLSGYGIAQVMEFAVSGLIAEGSLIDLFPDWPDERFPMYALYPSRNYLPAKTRTFLEFVTSLVSPKINRSGQYVPASKKI